MYPPRVSYILIVWRSPRALAVALPDDALPAADSAICDGPSWPTGSNHVPFHHLGRVPGVLPSENAINARLFRTHPRMIWLFPKRVSIVVTVPSGHSYW